MGETFNDVIDLGPELFATGDRKIICWKGEWYYGSCSAPVRESDQGLSHCVKPYNHPSKQHEDFFGNVTN